MSSLLDNARFLPLANLVAQHGVRFFVEPDAGGDATGMEAAKRLNLHGIACDTYHADALHARFPDYDVYDGDPLTFLREVLPKIDGPAYFWIDGNTPTSAQEVELIDAWAGTRAWFVDVKQKVDNQFDRSEEFDRKWSGPEEMKPRVYRTQSEKDTWHAVVVDNEYKLGPLKPTDVVLDIGAHIGSFSWLAHHNGSREVHAFEVDPWHLEAARFNLNQIEDGVTLYHAAVVRSDSPPSTVKYDGTWNVFSPQGIDVNATSLDEIITKCGPVRFLKTDSEGSEWPILYTCTKLDQVQEIAGEYHEDITFSDPDLPPCNIVALGKFLWERWGFHVTFTRDVPGIGNFYAKRA